MFSSNTSQVSSDATYIEDVFSTYLYTGNGSTQTITNGIDLAGKGGLVWLKGRSALSNHRLVDSARGNQLTLSTNTTAAQYDATPVGPSLTSSGFSVGNWTEINDSGLNYVSWTFRKQPKFFDVVTFSTDGSGAATFSHALGSTPGCVIIKRTGGAEAWYVYHRSLTSSATQRYVQLNTTGAETNVGFDWISVSNTSCSINGLFATSSTYVAYIFAHNAGGFGLTGTDNVISCGSYTGNGLIAGPVIDLGYEPQWVLVKRTDSTGNWLLQDNMRSLSQTNTDILFPNLSNAATTGAYPTVVPTATGFYIGDNGTNYNANGGTYIYIAIRRGPMKVPTDGTSVFSPTASSAASGTAITTNFPVDMQIGKYRSGAAANQVVDRLRGISTNTTGAGVSLSTSSTAAEVSDAGTSLYWDNTGFQMPANLGGISDIFWNFRRAPGFFDEVCYTGNGPGTQVITHNLGVAPELSIFKARSGTGGWTVYNGATQFLRLNETAAGATDGNISPTSTSVTVSSSLGFGFNASGVTYVAYLFASAPGVSKIGSYTGNGSTQTINCGFTGGARFVLIKRTDSTGGWYVYDTARGMTTLTDPYLLLNSTAAESATLGSVTTVSTGFAVDASILAAVNTNAATYIYLAIA